MAKEYPSESEEERLNFERNLWLATTRDNFRPHLVPVWFAWADGRIYICIQGRSVKGRNLAANPKVAGALENGSQPLICEGVARVLPVPWPENVCDIFSKKYDWDITADKDYDTLVVIHPQRWLSW